jgi:ribosomal protein S18 acetylase RimI-like enzyme
MNERFTEKHSKIGAKRVRIRRATITDAIPFLKLEAVCFEMKFADASLYYWRPIIEYCYAFKAVLSNKIVGGVIAIPTRNGQIYINSLFVHTKFRKLGIATKLLDRILMIGSKNGYVLDVKPKKRHLISFYTKYGFRVIRTKQNYYLDGAARILMTRLDTSVN